VREVVHRSRLVIARNHERASAVGLQVLRDRRQELRRGRVGERAAGAAGRQRLRRRFDFRGTQREAVIRLRARQGRRALDRVEPVHRRGRLAPFGRRARAVFRVDRRAAPISEVARVPDAGRAAAEEVGVERHDHVGLVEVIDRVGGLAGGLPRSRPRAVPRHAVPLVPLRLRKRLLDLRDLIGRRGRRHRLRQETDARPPLALLVRQDVLDRRQEVPPAPDVAAVEDGLRPIGVVEGQDRGLGEDVGGPEARRMLWIPFDFGRMTFVAFDQDGGGHASKRNRGREEQRPAGDELFGLADVGDDLLGRLLRARADAGKSQRRAHQLEELPAPLWIVPFGGLLRELPVQVLPELGRIGELPEAAPVQAPVGPGEARSDGGKVHKVSYQSPVSSCQ
jgi:hypothetical protein